MEYFSTIDYLVRERTMKEIKEEERRGARNDGTAKYTGMRVPGMYKSPRRSPRMHFKG